MVHAVLLVLATSPQSNLVYREKDGSLQEDSADKERPAWEITKSVAEKQQQTQ